MTGEIDLLGKVMPVGGIREKTMAARRSNITCLVFPKANKRDFDELPDHLKAGLDVHFAENYEQVVRCCGDLPRCCPLAPCHLPPPSPLTMLHLSLSLSLSLSQSQYRVMFPEP